MSRPSPVRRPEPAVRVALLTNFIPPYRAPLLRALAARLGGLRVLLSTPMERNRDWSPDWEGLDVRVQRGLTVPRQWRHPGGFSERLALHVPLDTGRHLDAYDPAVVIAAELGARSLQAARWARRRDRPLVIWATLSERTEAGLDRARRWLRRHLLDRAAGVIVNGESGARYIRGFGYPDARIYRIPYASPLGGPPPGPSGSRPQRRSGALRLVVVGQLVERKGLEPFLREARGWCESRGEPLHVTVVGAGPLEPRLRAIPVGRLLDVRFEGSVPFEDLPARYAAADALAFPTLADEWGLVVNEAMACGLPVLGSVHAQAVTELVEDGRTGWRYDPEEPGALAAALDRVASTPAGEIRRMGAGARQRLEELTPAAMAARISDTIEDVLAGRRPRP